MVSIRVLEKCFSLGHSENGIPLVTALSLFSSPSYRHSSETDTANVRGTRNILVFVAPGSTTADWEKRQQAGEEE